MISPELEEKMRENEPGKGWGILLLIIGIGLWIIIIEICKNL